MAYAFLHKNRLTLYCKFTKAVIQSHLSFMDILPKLLQSYLFSVKYRNNFISTKKRAVKKVEHIGLPGTAQPYIL